MIVTLCKRFLCLFLVMTLVGCGGNLAPVTELKWNPWRQKVYIVKRGDTLFSIAFRYDTDFRTLARLNHIYPPYALRVGQVINLQGIVPRHRQTARRPVPIRHYYVAPKARPSVIYSPANRYARSSSGWLWPVSGRVITSFVPEQGKKA